MNNENEQLVRPYHRSVRPFDVWVDVLDTHAAGREIHLIPGSLIGPRTTAEMTLGPFQ